MNYLYDDTFEGFLTCVWHHWRTARAEGIFSDRGVYQLDLTRYAQSVETDQAKADIVADAIERKISRWDAARVYRVFCTNEPEKEMKLLRYIRLGFKEGPKIRLLHGHPDVLAVQKAEERFGAEVHRLCGLVRFSELADGILYGAIEPDNDVLAFLAPHFCDRFKSDPFVIHDKRRGKALFAHQRKWEIAAMGEDASVLFSEREADIRALWKQYFGVMETKERHNPKLQRQFLPVRYHKYLTELQG
ncbi:MAG: TIGR03915 family putative DNA repair protein [Clostridiales Family XIII bacterium]|nr:TIGR03915 family putative DNA repair protein [Clostridiales Family XIII bacterium]